MERVFLDDAWQVRSSAEVNDDEGRRASSPGFDASAWYPARLPATVLGALIEAGVYPDPFPEDAFVACPGSVRRDENFSNHPFPDGSPFSVPWWYRREFELPEASPGDQQWLHFEGVNYRAALFVNGRNIAGPEHLVGAYRVFDLRITDEVAAGLNALSIRVSPPAPDDLALTWVDWNPSPPDKNLGLWRRAWLRRTGPVALFDPHVVSRLTPGGAELDVFVDVENASDATTHAELRFELEGRAFSREVTLAPRERTALHVAASDEPELRLSLVRASGGRGAWAHRSFTGSSWRSGATGGSPTARQSGSASARSRASSTSASTRCSGSTGAPARARRRLGQRSLSAPEPGARAPRVRVREAHRAEHDFASKACSRTRTS